MIFLKVDYFTPFLVCLCSSWRLSGFLGVIKPLEDTSKQVSLHLILTRQSSHKVSVLFQFDIMVFLYVLFKGTCTLKKCMGLFDFSSITLTGFCAVMQISGGTDPTPAAVWPGMSLKTVYFSVSIILTT